MSQTHHLQHCDTFDACHNDQKMDSRFLAAMNILICTPGRLLQHMDETPEFDASNVQIFVLDEADRILDMVLSLCLWYFEPVSCMYRLRRASGGRLRCILCCNPSKIPFWSLQSPSITLQMHMRQQFLPLQAPLSQALHCSSKVVMHCRASPHLSMPSSRTCRQHARPYYSLQHRDNL